MAHVIDADLQVDLILDAVIAEFEKEFLPIHAFATQFLDQPLQGTDKVRVKYRPLNAKTVHDFDEAEGYATLEESEMDSKEVTVNKRKYVGVEFKSIDLSRQPELDRAGIVADAARDLCEAVLTDVLSVVTAANGFAVAKTSTAANFDFDDIVDIKDILDTTQAEGEAWPKAGRRIWVKPAYMNNLIRDAIFHEADKAGTDEFRKTGRIGQMVAGFDLFDNDFIPSNSENLTGMVIHESAILFATAPVPPQQGTMQIVDYRTVTSDISGLTLEYRQWFDPTLDKLKEVLELNYGYAVGYTHALKRIKSS